MASIINLTETLLRREAESLFTEIPKRRGGLCMNPVTGHDFFTASTRSNLR
jgi:hypothetical protein